MRDITVGPERDEVLVGVDHVPETIRIRASVHRRRGVTATSEAAVSASCDGCAAGRAVCISQRQGAPFRRFSEQTSRCIGLVDDAAGDRVELVADSVGATPFLCG
jgi:hypothetical protein